MKEIKDKITIFLSVVSIIVSVYAISVSREANNKAQISNNISVSEFNFENLDDDVKKIQNAITNQRLSGNDIISDDDKKILIDVYNGLTQHIDLDYSNNSVDYAKVLKKGNELKFIMEETIINLVPEIAGVSSTKSLIPKTPELPNLEKILNEYKSLKRKYLLGKYNN